MLKLDMKVGQKVQIGEATVILSHKSGQLITLVIDADPSIRVRKLVEESPSIRLIADRGLMTGQ